MIQKMKVLLRVKELKLDQAFRLMQAKRGQLAAAQAAHAQARAALAESAATYGAREDAIYDAILGRVIDQGGVDGAQARVVQLQKAHEVLKDEVSRAAHVEARATAELEAAVEGYRTAVKMRDKFGLITDEMLTAAAREADGKDEAEVEDMFSRPRARAA